jgi:hypothetical protein
MFNKIYSLQLIVFFFLFSSKLVAQDIQGVIIDKKEGGTLSGASIKIVGTNKGIISNEKGVLYFLINQ